MADMKWYDLVSYLLLVIAGLNWGLVEFLNFNLVTFLSFSVGLIATILYGLVTVAGVYGLVMFVKLLRD